MKTESPNAQTLSVAALLALSVGAAAYAGLAVYGQPENFETRLANLQDRATEIERLSRGSRSARGYRPGALCPLADAEQLGAVAADLQSRASSAGLTVLALVVTPPTEEDQVSRVGIQFELSGSYQATTGFLATLASQSPRMFVDQLDLTDRSPQVSLRFKGHFYCSTAT